MNIYLREGGQTSLFFYTQDDASFPARSSPSRSGPVLSLYRLATCRSHVRDSLDRQEKLSGGKSEQLSWTPPFNRMTLWTLARWPNLKKGKEAIVKTWCKVISKDVLYSLDWLPIWVYCFCSNLLTATLRTLSCKSSCQDDRFVFPLLLLLAYEVA